MEGSLACLAASRYADDLVLKGGVLLAAYAARRPTRDIDLQARGFTGDIDEVLTRAREVIALARADGLAFDPTVSADTIRDDDQYSGVRVSMTARLATATIPFHIDVNFGDPIWPGPTTVELPLLLGGELTIIGYPVHMVLAEKIVTAVDRGTANTRWRDFVDIATIAARNDVRGADLETALTVVAEFRQVTLRPLGIVLDGMGAFGQTRWAAWRRKQQLDRTPSNLQDLVDLCRDFADPPIERQVGDQVWREGRWRTSES